MNCFTLLSVITALVALSGFHVAAADKLAPAIQEHLEKYPKLPSMAAVVIVDGKVAGAGAAGVRKLGDPTPVTIYDKYHIGSLTKAFTATLAAQMVEEGNIKWDTTLGQVLGDLHPHEGYEEATLKQLLSNCGGLPNKIKPDIWKDVAWGSQGEPLERREQFAGAMLALPPPYPPGTKNEYSNTGFTIAGMMLERTAGLSWENLIRRQIFIPLKMSSAGFYGPAKDPLKPDQPWGHTHAGKPVPPGPGADNPPSIGPAGVIHCSVPDLTRWAMMHMKRDLGPVLKQSESYTELHTPVLDDYAMGWIVVDRPWAHGKALTHSGSNTMYYAVVWIAPERNFAVVAATNIGLEVATAPVDEFVGKMIQRYLD